VPALTVIRNRAYVVGGGSSVASVDLRSLAVSAHVVPGLLHESLPATPPTETGSAGPQRLAMRSLSRLGPHTLLVGGTDEYPVNMITARYVVHAVYAVDTRTWRVEHVFHGLASVRRLGGLLVGSGAQTVEKTVRGPTLVGLRRSGGVLYRLEGELWWEVAAGRLIAGNPDGSWVAELDPATGRIVRKLGRASIWPLDVLRVR
jgi:hypothetical protein